jgi:hypothetical protein
VKQKDYNKMTKPEARFWHAICLFWQHVHARCAERSGHVEQAPVDGYEDEQDVSPRGWIS